MTLQVGRITLAANVEAYAPVGVLVRITNFKNIYEMKKENKGEKKMKGFRVDGGFVKRYSEMWGEEKIVGYLKKGMTLRQWIRNKALYDAKKEEREALIDQLFYCHKQVSRIRKTQGDASHYLDQCLILEIKLNRLMTNKR